MTLSLLRLDRSCPTLPSIQVFDAFEIDVTVIRSPMPVSRSPFTVTIYADLDLFWSLRICSGCVGLRCRLVAMILDDIDQI